MSTCDYELRLTEAPEDVPRCPQCGQRFAVLVLDQGTGHKAIDLRNHYSLEYRFVTGRPVIRRVYRHYWD